MSQFGTGLSKRVEKFVVNNSYIITIGLVLFFVYVFFEFGSLTNENKKILHLVKKDIGSVIFLTSSGQVVKLKKSPVSYKDSRIAKFIADKVVNDLVQDLATISKGFKKTYPNATKLLRDNQRFYDFYKNYDANNFARRYLRNLLTLINEDELPEYINVYNIQPTKYIVYEENGKKKFKMIVKVDGIVKAWYKEIPDRNKWRDKQITFYIKLHGYFNLMRYGSLENPFGIKIVVEELPIPTKRT